MDFKNYYITFLNFEEEDVEIQLQDLDTLDDPPGDTININLTGSESPAIMESVSTDDDKTLAIRPKRLKIGFLSGDEYDIDGAESLVDVSTFSDGSEGRFLTRILVGNLTLPFIGGLILDDNSEAFQPRPNPVLLNATDGLNSLSNIEITESDGDILVGHFRIIDYIYLCLRHLTPSQDIHVVFNLYEEDTDPSTSHAFFDTMLDARTFETDVDKRDDCKTVLTKILDAFGCFIAYDHDGWWIIRWDEYDAMGTSVLTHRTANFNSEGTFINYTLEDLTKVVAADYDVLYEGHRLSQDNAVRRFQRKANKVTHKINFEQFKELPCNAKFTRGTADDVTLPLLTFEPSCWTMQKGVPGAYGSPGSVARINVNHDANEVEIERYLSITPEATHSSSSTNQTYLESEAMPMLEGDKFDVDVDWRLESDATNGGNYNLMRIMLAGNDGSYWLVGGESPTGDSRENLRWWDTSIWTVNTAAGGIDVDFTTIEETEWQPIKLEVPALPVDGDVYIWLNQINQTNIAGDDRTIHYTGVNLTYIPLINGTYKTSLGQEQTASADNDSRKTIEKEMFIGDLPRPLFKGALKKFDGSNYVLTGDWNDYITPASMTDQMMSKFILFQWWNQFKKTRTVIETDLQGIRSNTEGGTPGLIHRWKINHAEETDKWFMLTSLKFLDFYNCGWAGVFVEMSDMDGDRSYDDDYEFKYIQ